MKNILIIITIVIITIFPGCTASHHNTEKYLSYVCYDNNLFCIKALPISGTSKTTKNDNGDVNNIEYSVQYRKVANVSDDLFICASFYPPIPLAGPELLILQNPKYYFDIWSEWSIKKLEIYYTDIRNSKQLWEEENPARSPTDIISTSFESETINEFAGFIKNSADAPVCEIPDQCVNEEFDVHGNYRLFLRVAFNECDSIIWDGEVNCYTSKDNNNTYITINSIIVDVNEFPHLYEAIETSIIILKDHN